MHGAGHISIGNGVGIGPFVKMLTSTHDFPPKGQPILEAPLTFAPIKIEQGADIGTGSIIMPGIHIGAGAQIGAAPWSPKTYLNMPSWLGIQRVFCAIGSRVIVTIAERVFRRRSAWASAGLPRHLSHDDESRPYFLIRVNLR